MSTTINVLLQELQTQFPSGQTSGSFDVTQVLVNEQGKGEYQDIFTGLVITNPIPLTSSTGWQIDSTNTFITFTGQANIPVLGVANPDVFFEFYPAGADWILMLEVSLPATGWSFTDSFTVADALDNFNTLLTDLQLTTPDNPGALIIASATFNGQINNSSTITLTTGLNLLETYSVPPSLLTLAEKVFNNTDIPSNLTISGLIFTANTTQTSTGTTTSYTMSLNIAGNWNFSFANTSFDFTDFTISITDGSSDNSESNSLSATMSGTFTTDDKNNFTVTLDLSSDEKTFSGSWNTSSGTLTYTDIANTLGIGNDLPSLPSGWTYEITGADFAFNFSKPMFAFEIDTTLTINSTTDTLSALLIAGKDSDGKNWGCIFGMQIGFNQNLNLTDIPSIGDLVPAGTDIIELNDISIVVASSNIPSYTPGDDDPNNILGTDPQSGLTLATDLTIGLLSQPFSINLGGSDSSSETSTTSSTPQVNWIQVQRSFGHLQINQIGFGLNNSDQLEVQFDASISMAGMELDVIGLGATMPLAKPFTPSFTLQGLELDYSATSLTISGGLEYGLDSTGNTEFTGDLAISIASFGVTVHGSYTTINNSPSLFAFLCLNAPIGGPPCFFVTGIAGGFGYNRSLLLPDISDVDSYPLVTGATGETDSSDTLTALNADIIPQINQDWLAAGLTFTSFEMVKSFALLTVSFGTNFEIALMGTSTLSIPPKATEAVIYAELMVLVDVQITNGVVAVCAQLAPSSYILSSSVQLTGGFAFYLWFGASPNAGDFVISLGGYNPYFSPPSYYPVVPLLGLNWQEGSNMLIKGGLYFALTPAVIMAGGLLEASYETSVAGFAIQVWFNVQADFLIRFQPFYYSIDASVSIGASVTFNLWVTSKTISVNVGVSLILQGPPFYGIASVDLKIVSFTLTFGTAPTSSNDNISWTEFEQSFLPSSSDSSQLTLKDSSTPATLTINAPTGIINNIAATDSSPAIWSVSPGSLQLVIATLVPSTMLTITNTSTIDTTSQWTTALGVGPMGAEEGQLTSTLTITISYEDDTTTSEWTPDINLGSVPAGLWSNTSATMQKNGTVANALLGVTLTPSMEQTANITSVSIQALLSSNPQPISCSWSGSTYQANSYGSANDAMTLMQNTLEGNYYPEVTSMCNSILTALQNQGLGTSTSINVNNFAENATDLLFITEPVLSYLGSEQTLAA